MSPVKARSTHVLKNAEQTARQRLERHVDANGLVKLMALEFFYVEKVGYFRGDQMALPLDTATEFVTLGYAVPVAELSREEAIALTPQNRRHIMFPDAQELARREKAQRIADAEKAHERRQREAGGGAHPPQGHQP